MFSARARPATKRIQEEDDEERARAFEDDTSMTVSDYQVSAKHLKHVMNDAHAGSDGNWHALLMVYIKSKCENKKINNQRVKKWQPYNKQDYIKACDSSSWKDYSQSWQKGHSSTSSYSKNCYHQQHWR